MKKIVAVAVAATEPKNDLRGAAKKKTMTAVGHIAAVDIVAAWLDRKLYYSLDVVAAVAAPKDAVAVEAAAAVAAGTGQRPPMKTALLRR